MKFYPQQWTIFEFVWIARIGICWKSRLFRDRTKARSHGYIEIITKQIRSRPNFRLLHRSPGIINCHFVTHMAHESVKFFSITKVLFNQL